MLPAYIPNPVAAIIGGGTPIDLGNRFWDGRRIFGNGKTYRGFLVGVGSGIAVGVVQIAIQPAVSGVGLPSHTYLSVFLLSLGALSGDLIKSFLKRRAGKEQGERWPVADQYDLVAGGFLFLALFDLSWLIATIDAVRLFWILILTPVLHRVVNIIGYATGIKDVPW
ncbi:MAG: CDP-2,3-bis-(O-geranylgeranyl)-sn-glycerol synthase [Methanomicrobiales archaeon]|nr:CDP-2,3-bis-(O-geranylgeranyl)-sn-glycerol synthase [Methanomicrobiales archaeon]